MLTDNYLYVAVSIAIMALITYALRMTPFMVFHKKIKSRFIRSFLYYVPYAVLSAMTFPAILSSTGNTTASIMGTAAAMAVAIITKSLLYTALAAAGTSLIMLIIL